MRLFSGTMYKLLVSGARYPQESDGQGNADLNAADHDGFGRPREEKSVFFLGFRFFLLKIPENGKPDQADHVLYIMHFCSQGFKMFQRKFTSK